MSPKAVVCHACKPKHHSMQELARQKRLREFKVAGMVYFPKPRPKPTIIQFPVGLRESYNTAIAIDDAIKDGRCCRHMGREEFRKGTGLCEECWDGKNTTVAGRCADEEAAAESSITGIKAALTPFERDKREAVEKAKQAGIDPIWVEGKK